jgi:hypothetical protein
VVVGRADDEVDLLQHAAFVGDVVVGQRSSRSLDASYPFGRGLCREHPDVIARDLVVGGEL